MAGKDSSQLGSSGLGQTGQGYGAGRFLGSSGMPAGVPTPTVGPNPSTPTPHGSVYWQMIADALAKDQAKASQIQSSAAAIIAAGGQPSNPLDDPRYSGPPGNPNPFYNPESQGPVINPQQSDASGDGSAGK